MDHSTTGEHESSRIAELEALIEEAGAVIESLTEVRDRLRGMLGALRREAA